MFSGNTLLAILHLKISKTFLLPAVLSNLTYPRTAQLERSSGWHMMGPRGDRYNPRQQQTAVS